ncbi:MAG TPA: hypothetical protein PLD55_06760 [bacterium]|nr:hypothetical protein [bacterium]HOG42692.1 hypothetical protein [bacterium]HPY13465.1 hypothetical protein [bacterium]HQB09846.1 hypothetical protein [bacterium]HQM84372.1 hypothetical protein [bacterium]
MKCLKKGILLIMFLFPVVLFSEDANVSDNKYKELKEFRDSLITRDALIDSIWEIIVKTMKEEKIPDRKKIEMVEKFIKDFNFDNKYLKKAEMFLSELKKRDGNIMSVFNSDSYRTKVEWFALNFAAGNFGFGGSFTLITLRGRNVFWEIARIQATGFIRKVAANGKTMVGVPFFLDSLNRNELRLSTGLSGGLSATWPVVDEDFDFHSYALVNIPIDISYVFHVDRNFAFQVGISVDFPVWNDGKYIPVVNGYMGFRI